MQQTYRHVLLIAAAALLIWTPQSVQAQAPSPSDGTAAERGRRQHHAAGPRRADGVGSMLGLLRSELVREELAVTEEQSGKLKDLAEELRGTMRSALQDLRDLAPEQRKEAIEKLRTQRGNRSDELSDKVKEVLTPKQFERLGQIHLQMRGTRALMEEDMQKTLEMTTEQVDKLQKIRDNLRQKMAALRAEFDQVMPGRGAQPQGQAAPPRRLRGGQANQGFRPRGGPHQDAPDGNDAAGPGRRFRQGASPEQRRQRLANMRENIPTEVREKLAGLREKVQELVAEAEEKTLSVLSSEQREQFEKMKGEKFEMPRRGPARRGVGPRKPNKAGELPARQQPAQQ